MRGTVAKKCRKILFALQVKKLAPQGTEYKITRKGQILATGARDVYQGMKLAHRARGGFVAQPRKVTTKRALLEQRREKARASRRRSRARRRERERAHSEELTEALKHPIEVPQL